MNMTMSFKMHSPTATLKNELDHIDTKINISAFLNLNIFTSQKL